MGELGSLADSIPRVRLLHPIVVTTAGKLVAGQESGVVRDRGRHAKTTGAVELESIDLSWKESAEAQVLSALPQQTFDAICDGDKTIRQVKGEKAKARMLAGKKPSGNLPEGDIGETRDKAASAVGMGARTYGKAKAVVEAAEESPQRSIGRGVLTIMIGEPEGRCISTDRSNEADCFLA